MLRVFKAMQRALGTSFRFSRATAFVTTAPQAEVLLLE
jgi:hypothetical protein